MLVLAGFLVFLIAIVVFVFPGPRSCLYTIDEEVIGQFGDFVGGVAGTIFALVGVLLYYVALSEQRKDLKVNQDNLKIQTDALTQQIEEFKAQKEEMAETRKVYEHQTVLFQEQTNLYREQSDAMKKEAEEIKKQTAIHLVQQFDASFYPLLNLFCSAQRENVKTIEEIYSKIQCRIVKTDDINKTFNKIINEYESQYQILGEPIGRLFHLINQLVQLVYKSPLLEDDKKKHYIGILHSQLSECTNVVLFYHLFSEAGINEKPLYCQSGFFEEMNFMKRCEFVRLYSPKVYFPLSKFACELAAFVRNSLEKAMSLEGLTSIIDEKISMMGIDANSQLEQKDDRLHYTLNVLQTEWVKTGLDKKDFSQFLTFLLHDVRYIRTFNMPMADKVICRIEEEEKKISFGYVIILD